MNFRFECDCGNELSRVLEAASSLDERVDCSQCGSVHVVAVTRLRDGDYT
jgi:hypothetical protein